jgi:hypothetical protein
LRKRSWSVGAGRSIIDVSGVFRALATLIHLTYGCMSKNTSFVMIDDIGEGLDFERSSALIKVLIERATGTNI